MDLSISVALHGLAFAAVIFPFSGSAWDRTARGIFKKLKWRGWAGLSCLLLSLLLGVVREVRGELRRTQSAAQQGELRASLIATQNELAATRQTLSDAAERGNALQATIEELNENLIRQFGSERDLAEAIRRAIRDEFIEMKATKPLTVQGSSFPSPTQSTAVLPRAGDSLIYTVGRVRLEMRLKGAAAWAWSWEIARLTIGPNVRITGTSFTVRPGQPVNIVRGKDLALVAGVAVLPSGARVPWLGIVSADEAPHISFYAAPDTLLLDQAQGGR